MSQNAENLKFLKICTSLLANAFHALLKLFIRKATEMMGGCKRALTAQGGQKGIITFGLLNACFKIVYHNRALQKLNITK
jgi:hypothetical protein